MTSEQLLKEGRLDETLKSLQKTVRDDPANAKPRIFLFQLLSVLGDWKRADTQLQVLADMDSDSMILARIFEPILLCEAVRADVFAGKRTPIIFGEPPEWIGSLVEAMAFFGKGEFRAGAELRDKAFEAAPASAGKLNGEPFEWIADADERLGPVLEVILEGRYYWIPFCRIRQVFIEPVTDLRDLVWVPAQFVWENGGQASGHIPSRYAGTERSEDSSLRLARKTEWLNKAGVHLGQGQRILATDANEYPILEIRTIELMGSDPKSDLKTGDT
jgi:type VI secretion system protein ImpE